MTIDEAILSLNIQKEYIKTALERPSVFFGGTVNQQDDFKRLAEALEESIDAIYALQESEENKPRTPCDVCRYNPPSACDGKPCTMCPADSIQD